MMEHIVYLRWSLSLFIALPCSFAGKTESHFIYFSPFFTSLRHFLEVRTGMHGKKKKKRKEKEKKNHQAKLKQTQFLNLD